MNRFLLVSQLMENQRKRNLIGLRKRLREESLPLELPEKEFIANFRLSKVCFRRLCNELSPLLNQGITASRISIELRVLATLSFLATGSYQRGVGNNFSLGMSQSAMSLAINEVVDALNHPTILRRHIQFPQTQQERELIMRGFMNKFGVPGVVGCVDGTHVALIRPKENEWMFYNRKHYHSRNVQIICDHNLTILHVDATFPGVTHDAFIWNQSEVKVHLEQLHDNGERLWLLGDSGYAQRPTMMIPILNPLPDSPEAFYNTAHIKARNTVERCIGVLKNRWRCLLAHRVLHYDNGTVAKIINACCVLHNIANKYRIPEPTLEPDEMAEDLRLQMPPIDEDEANGDEGNNDDGSGDEGIEDGASGDEADQPAVNRRRLVIDDPERQALVRRLWSARVGKRQDDFLIF